MATRDIPGRPAQWAEVPGALHPQLRRALRERGVDQLYSHQAEMFDRARRGEDLVITTGTASGKSLAFLLPVLQSLLEDPAGRALMLYPTKALSQDQLRGLVRLTDEVQNNDHSWGGEALEAGVYDGDTPPLERRRIRERANLVMTNPDMLNAGLIPAHGRQGYSHIFRNVRFIVIDEMHIYRGAFGAHVSNVLRRLLRVCEHYGSRPQFLCSSATIANPKQLAGKLCHRDFGLIDEDGSPSLGKTIHFWMPPLVDADRRRGIGAEMASLLPHLIKQRVKSIAFCRSRKETEVVLKETRDRLKRVDRDHDESNLLSGYRGGYTPAERRKVEKDLIEGRLLGVVSTNALELGIDIGSLEVVVQAGFPGTRASFWQQVGRAGRRGRRAHAIVLLAQAPIDQFVAQDPDWLTGQDAEHAVVDPDNLTVQLAHLRSAAAELPLTLDDAAIWPDLAEVIPVLAEAGEVRAVGGTWHWTGSPFPAGDFSLRNTDGDRFKLVDRTSGHTLTEMTRPQTYREAHPRAIYLHGGRQFMIEALDLVGHVATIVPVEQNYYTQPDVRTHIEVLVHQERREVGRTVSHFGDVRVDDAVVGYKMLQFHNHQNLGYERLHQELALKLETEAVWWAVPGNVAKALAGEGRDILGGMVHALRAVARLRTMAEGGDLLGTSFKTTDPQTGETVTAVVCYDNHPGGIGFASKAYELADVVARDAAALVRDCPCPNGCPACVGDFSLDKSAVLWALENLFNETPTPAALAAPKKAQVGGAANDDSLMAAPRLAWEGLNSQWPEVRRRLRNAPERGGAFLASIESASVRGNKLVLALASAELARWVESDESQPTLRGLIESVVATPGTWRLVAEVDSEEADAASKRTHKVRRRLEDLSSTEARSERAANKKLASGFSLRTDPPATPEQRAAEGPPPTRASRAPDANHVDPDPVG